MLPPLVHLEELPVAEKRSGIPIGLEEFRLSPFYVDLIAREPHFIILGDTECGKTSLLRTWMRGLEQGYLPQEVSFAIIDYRKQLLDFAESKHLISYAYNPLTLASCIGNLRSDLEKRVEKSSGAPLSELRHTRNWGGRHLFLFVDDYESISGTGGSQLLPLADYLLNGRDIGFHLVVTHRVGGMARASFEPIFQRLREMGTSGLIMSGDPSEGKLLYGLAASPLPAGRGYFVQSKHPPVLIQTAWGESVMQSETPSGISSLSH
jgi:S-DNA-T family DNA segregation ATPase FtsK/SpoIIIE